MSNNTYTHEQVQELLKANSQHILKEASFNVNSNMDSGIRQRIASLVSGGYDFADTLHNIYLDFGYPAHIRFFNLWNMYRRFGIAKNVVEIYPDLGWMEAPIIETNEKVIKELEKIDEAIGLWTRIKGLDTRQRVGRYAGMFMRVRDGKTPDQPIEGTLSGPGSLVDMIPLYESQLEVIDTQDDIKADDYGQPTMYEFRGGTIGARNPDARNSFNIHPSRIIIASEDSDNGSIYGVSSLESVYNSLMDLRKIIGAGGEGFYKNAAQSIVFDLKDAASAKKNKELLDKFNDQYDDFAKNRSRRSMWTPGMEANTLESSLVQPKEFFMNALNDVAAGSKIPATILIGQQTGRLASNEDSRSLLSNVQSRRENFQTVIVRDVLRWLMKFGIIAKADFEIDWTDALALSDNERLDNAGKMATINKDQFTSGGDVPFSGEEIRKAAGFDPEETEEIPDESDDEEIDEEEEEPGVEEPGVDSDAEN